MQMIDSMRNLYQEDSRTGDCLLMPQRWCHRQWDYILYSPFDENNNQFVEIAIRTAQIALLILPTIISYACVLAGISIKVFSSEHVSKKEPISTFENKKSVSLDTVEPVEEDSVKKSKRNKIVEKQAIKAGLFENYVEKTSSEEELSGLNSSSESSSSDDESSSEDMDNVKPRTEEKSSESKIVPSATWDKNFVSDVVKSLLDMVTQRTEEKFSESKIASIDTLRGTSAFDIDFIAQDIFCYIVTFLPVHDRLEIMRVSVRFNKEAQHPVIWNDTLQDPDIRIWGATKWKFVNTPKVGYSYQPDGIGIHDPLKQLKVYFELTKTFGSASGGSINNYMARLMPGGPVAYQEALNNNVVDANNLSIADMPISSFMHGTDAGKNSFFALKIIDHAEENEEPTLLIFIDSKRGWIQKANKYWKEKELNLENEIAKDYVLAILKKEDLSNRTEWFLPKYKKTISLV